MIRHLKTETVPLTKMLAHKISSMPASPTERPYSQKRAQFILDKLVSGQFFTPKWATARVVNSTTEYRINGQHSSRVLDELNGQFPQGLHAVIDRFEVDSADDLPLLFAQFDQAISNRNRKDVINAYASLRPELTGVNIIHLSVILSGYASSVNFIRGGKSGKMHALTQDELADLVNNEDFVAFAVWSQRVFSTSRNEKNMRKVPLYMALHRMYAVDPDAAVDFWNQVINESNPEPKHPTRVFARFLMMETGRNSTIRNKFSWNATAIAAKAIHAWNAYRNGKTTTMPYHQDAEFPTAI